MALQVCLPASAQLQPPLPLLPAAQYRSPTVPCLPWPAVTRGEVEGTVEFTGSNTFFGKTASMLQGNDGLGNLQKILLKVRGWMAGGTRAGGQRACGRAGTWMLWICTKALIGWPVCCCGRKWRSRSPVRRPHTHALSPP